MLKSTSVEPVAITPASGSIDLTNGTAQTAAPTPATAVAAFTIKLLRVVFVLHLVQFFLSSYYNFIINCYSLLNMKMSLNSKKLFSQ